MKSNIFLIAFILISSFCQAQEYDIKGTVTEAQTGLGLPGANVSVKNGTQQTTADFDGNFTLAKIPSGSIIVFSYVGFVTKEVAVTSNQTITVQLQSSEQSLEEVVVIGYGTQRKRDVTGAVGIVSSKTIEELRPVKVEQALQGTVSGVNVTSQSGSPGAALDIRIRGISSNGANGPLVIIDGYQGDLSLLNPTDIESITVLKDAQAAIYGIIGANGVVLVTTKKGKKDSKTRFSYNTYFGVQSTTRKLPLLNATEYAMLLNESYANNGQPIPYPNATGLGKGTDWQDEVFNDSAPIQNHDFSVSGGSEKIVYTLSGSHLFQEGIVGGTKSDFRRNTARLSLGADLSDKLKLETNAIYTYVDRDALSENNLGAPLFNAISVPSTISAYDSNGDYTLVPNTPGLGNEVINPLAQIANTFNDYDLRKLNGSIGLDYKLVKGLTFTGRIGFNTLNSESRSFAKQVSYGGKVFDNPRSSVSQNKINSNDYTLDLFGTYKLATGDHELDAVLGTTIFEQWGSGLYGTGFDVPNNSWDFADISISNGLSEAKPVNSYVSNFRRTSYFARVNYSYKGRYLLTGIMRQDASTRFIKENRVGYHPSVLGGWIVSDEPFFGDSRFISFLKFRGSYGILGNDEIGDNRYRAILNGEAVYLWDGTLVTGTAIGTIPNKKIKWETDRKFDVGFDLRLANDKVEIAGDYFINTRNDLLINNTPISGIIGAGGPGGQSPTINAGTVRNKGFEFSINYKDKITDDFSFAVGYNFTTLDNEVLKVNNQTGFVESGAFGVGQQPPARMEVGETIGYFYGLQTDGIFQNQAEVDAHPSQSALGAPARPGDIRFKDVNGDGKIDANDRTNIGDPIPDVTMGFNLQFNYKGFDFVAYTYASLGNDMVRNYERSLSDINRHNYVLDRWTGEGTSNSVPRVTIGATSNNVFSDYFVEDASFVRIQNVQLGYTLNKDLTERAMLSKVRIYAGVNNLYTFTKYKGYDPAATSGAPIGGGIDYGFYPVPKTYMFGINLNF